MKGYLITEQFKTALISYLETKPYAEVSYIISSFNQAQPVDLKNEIPVKPAIPEAAPTAPPSETL